MFIYEFAQSKGILASDLRRWLKEYPTVTIKAKKELTTEEFGIININMNEKIIRIVNVPIHC